MARISKQAEPDEAPGAPEWMVTFSDCMTLLLTFFVLLLSFSSFDEKVFRRLRMIFSNSLPAITLPDKEDKDAFLPIEQIEATAKLDAGSEKPTLVEGLKDRLKEETEPANFQYRKVFLISSKRIFWGKGPVISSEGRSIMATMASYLKQQPGRIVISENGPVDDEGSEHFGLPRAWALLEYLTTKQNLDKKWFSISAASTISKESPGSDEPVRESPEAERTVEIVLLERSIYN